MINEDIGNKVFRLLEQVPAGRVTTYAAIAREVGINPRHVGKILHQNPQPEYFPCHRVVKADGNIASGYAFGGRQAQIKKLALEGVSITGKKIVSFHEYLFTFTNN